MQTIIAAFEDAKTAQQAIDALVRQGFSSDSIHLQSGDEKRKSASSSAGVAVAGDPFGFFRFFSTLMGASAGAGNYAEAVHRGSAVVVLEAATDAEIEKATQLMQELGVVDLDKRAQQWKSEGWTGFDAGAEQPDTQATSSEQQVVPVVQEELQIGKRSVEGGGVRVVKRVTETPVSELVKLRQERATVERRAADREATAEDLENFEEGTVELRERSEEAVVAKTARVVEEVVLGKEVTERTDTVSGNVRRTNVEVEVEDGAGTKASVAATGQKKVASPQR